MIKVLVLLGLLTAPAFADTLTVSQGNSYTGSRVTISKDTGGVIFDYVKKYNQYRQGNTYVRIDDLCLSACTLILGLVPDSHVCVSPFALFGFHSATDEGDFSKEGTDLIWNLYPKKVQDLVKQGGWNGSVEHHDFVYIRGTDLYSECPGE